MARSSVNPATTSEDGTRSLVTWGILVLAAVLPIVLLSFFAYRVAADAICGLVRANNESAAEMAAELVTHDIDGSIGLAKGLAAMPGMAEAVESHDVDSVRQRLRSAVQASPRVDRAYVLDPQGVLWADFPVARESLGRDFSHRDYYRGLSRRWEPYVSEVFQRHASPQPLVIAVAAPVRSGDRKVLGGVVVQHRLEELTDWVDDITVGDQGYVFLIDRHGVVAAHPKLALQAHPYTEYAALPAVQAAMNGERSTVEYFDPLAQATMVATFMPVNVGGHPWVVAAQQPREEAYAPIRELKWELGAATGALAVAALTVVVLLGAIRQQLRQANRELAAEAAERRLTADELRASEESLRQLLEVYERHRQLAAYEIHDGLAQPLAAAIMRVESLVSAPTHDLETMRTQAASTLQLLRGSLAEARRLMSGLRPALLDDFGVLAAVEHLVKESQSGSGVEIDWSHEVAFQRLAAPLETAVFRIIQEGINNALRHSKTNRVRIRLQQAAERLCIEIEDWGCGFDPHSVERNRFGLHGLCERAELFGGTATIDSAPGRGTRLVVELPIVEAVAPP
jgi:signal transduction histidine kinase